MGGTITKQPAAEAPEPLQGTGRKLQWSACKTSPAQAVAVPKPVALSDEACIRARLEGITLSPEMLVEQDARRPLAEERIVWARLDEFSTSPQNAWPTAEVRSTDPTTRDEPMTDNNAARSVPLQPATTAPGSSASVPPPPPRLP